MAAREPVSVDVGHLAAAVERVVGIENMQKLRHPPGEALHLPHPPQTDARIRN